MSLLDEQEIIEKDQLSGTTLHYLLRAAKWMQFIAIAGFIFIGLFGIMIFLIPGMFMGGISGMPGSAETSGMIVAFLLIIAVGFFPNLFLYQSAINFIRYARDNNSFNLETGIKKLHSLFLFTGILIIIYLAIMIIALAAQGLIA